MARLIALIDPSRDIDTVQRIVLGLHHEQQHQELLLTDLKSLLALNPLQPIYRAPAVAEGTRAAPVRWLEFSGGLYDIGFAGESFAFDNETPRHRVFLDNFAIASRPVTNREYLEFMAAGGYRNAALWLSDGWRKLN